MEQWRLARMTSLGNGKSIIGLIMYQLRDIYSQNNHLQSHGNGEKIHVEKFIEEEME